MGRRECRGGGHGECRTIRNHDAVVGSTEIGGSGDRQCTRTDVDVAGEGVGCGQRQHADASLVERGGDAAGGQAGSGDGVGISHGATGHADVGHDAVQKDSSPLCRSRSAGRPTEVARTLAGASAAAGTTGNGGAGYRRIENGQGAAGGDIDGAALGAAAVATGTTIRTGSLAPLVVGDTVAALRAVAATGIAGAAVIVRRVGGAVGGAGAASAAAGVAQRCPRGPNGALRAGMSAGAACAATTAGSAVVGRAAIAAVDRIGGPVLRDPAIAAGAAGAGVAGEGHRGERDVGAAADQQSATRSETAAAAAA